MKFRSQVAEELSSLPRADPKKYFFFFFWKLRGEKVLLLSPALPCPPSVDHPLLILEFRLYWSRRPSFCPAGAILVSRDAASALPGRPPAVLGPCVRGGCGGRRLSAGTTTRPSQQRPLRRAWSQPGWILARVQGRLKLINMQNKTSTAPTHALPLSRTTSHKARIRKLQTQIRTVGNQARDKIFPPEECWLLTACFHNLTLFLLILNLTSQASD